MTHLFRLALVTLALLLLTAAATVAQTAVTPGQVAFTCPDHAEDTDHELGYFLAGAVNPVQTATLGDPAEISGEVVATVPARPINIGQYLLKVRVFAVTWSAWAAGGPAGDQPVPFERAVRPAVNLRRLP